MGDPPAWRIRPACPEDAPACAAIAVRAWEPVHAAYARILGTPLHDRLWPSWREDKARAVARHVRERPGDAAVAEEDGPEGLRLLGFVTWSCDVTARVGEIGNNAVDPARQGAGVGSALHRHALEVFRHRGMEVARVTTGLDEGHAPARRAYARAGFTLGLPSITYYMALRP